jgi:hypothetical protein
METRGGSISSKAITYKGMDDIFPYSSKPIEPENNKEREEEKIILKELQD